MEEPSASALDRSRKEVARSGRVGGDVLEDTAKNLLHDSRLIDAQTRCLARAALLSFHSGPKRFVIGTYIKISFFRDNKDNLEFRDEVRGLLMEQMSRAMDLIKTKYLIYHISYEGIPRCETPQFPVKTVKEPLMNAITYKDCASAVPIQISVSPDHITFRSAGQLPESWMTRKLLESHPSTPYNLLIVNAFSRSGDIESWGRDYRRILGVVSAYKLLLSKPEMLSSLMITYYTGIRLRLLAQQVDERPIPIIEYTARSGSATNSDVQGVLNTNRATAYRLL